jgi:hypothetical protein
MNLAAEWSGILGAFLGFILTLLVFSYIFGDNALFRFAVHVFVGVAAAFMAAVAFYSVLWPRLLSPVFFGLPVERLIALVPLALSALLLTKASPRLAGWGGAVMAFMVGVGAAAAIGGAIVGTLIPQVQASVNLLDTQAIATSGRSFGWELFNGVIILFGTVLTLAYFHFNVRSPRPLWAQGLTFLGKVMIAIALGVVFAGVYAAALTALVERLSALVEFIFWFINPAA